MAMSFAETSFRNTYTSLSGHEKGKGVWTLWLTGDPQHAFFFFFFFFAFRVVSMPPWDEGDAVSVVTVCHPSPVCLSDCSRRPGQALCCICSNDPLFRWIITGSMSRAATTSFFFVFLPLIHVVTRREDELLTYESWKKIKQRKQTSLPENLPKTSVSFKPAKPVMEKKPCLFCVFERFFPFCFPFLWQKVIYNTAVLLSVAVWAEYWKAIG